MRLKNGAEFKEKLTFGFKYDMRDFVNFYPTTQCLKVSVFGVILVQIFRHSD